MKILVTGGAGFIGSHIVDAYIDAGHQVSIIDNLVTGDETNLNQQAIFYKLDITSKEANDLIISENFDIINHQAAQIDVRIAVENPVFDAQSNILGTINILEAAVKSTVKKIIFPSSGGAVYGEIPDDRLPASEDFPINPLSPYGAAKHAVEHYLYLYNKLYNLNYTILRYGNVYGERQSKKGEAGVVSIFARLLAQNKTVTIFGDGEQLRDYIYVKDVVRINMIVSDLQRNFPEPTHFNDWIYNVGTGSGYSVNLLYKHMAEYIKTEQKPVYEDARKGEIFKTYINCDKALRNLDFKADFSFKEGIQSTFKWFLENK